MDSDYDYINEHLGGHDDDGIPNFLNEIDPIDNKDNYDFLEEKIENDQEISQENTTNMEEKSYYILENLIARIELEGQSLKYITQSELESLRYALAQFNTSLPTINIDIDDDDIPF